MSNRSFHVPNSVFGLTWRHYLLLLCRLGRTFGSRRICMSATPRPKRLARARTSRMRFCVKRWSPVMTTRSSLGVPDCSRLTDVARLATNCTLLWLRFRRRTGGRILHSLYRHSHQRIPKFLFLGVNGLVPFLHIVRIQFARKSKDHDLIVIIIILISDSA